MSWTRLARRDFGDAVRSRSLWGVIGAFLLLVVILAAAANSGDTSNLEPVDLYPGFSELGAMFLIPIVAVMIGYKAIVGERESGSLRMLFGFSYNRMEVFVAKFTSRLSVIAIATIVPTVSIVLAGLVLFGEIPIATALGFVGLTVLLGTAFVSVAVGASAIAESRYRAIGGSIATYILFLVFWHPLVAGIHYVTNGELAGLEPPHWYLFLLRLNPLEVYTQTIGSYTGQHLFVLINWAYEVEDVPDAAIQSPDMLLLENRVAGEIPIYLSDWFAPVTMLVWIVVPALIGYWRFERADLN